MSDKPKQFPEELARQVEFWSVLLAGLDHDALSNDELEGAILVARKCVSLSAPPRFACLGFYVMGKVLLVQRSKNPDWRRSVPYAALFATEWAYSAQDENLGQLSLALLHEFVHLALDPGADATLR